jgi:hypothetical protein
MRQSDVVIERRPAVETRRLRSVDGSSRCCSAVCSTATSAVGALWQARKRRSRRARPRRVGGALQQMQVRLRVRRPISAGGQESGGGRSGRRLLRGCSLAKPTHCHHSTARVTLAGSARATATATTTTTATATTTAHSTARSRRSAGCTGPKQQTRRKLLWR